MNRRRGKGGREWGGGRKKRERMDEDTFLNLLGNILDIFEGSIDHA